MANIPPGAEDVKVKLAFSITLRLHVGAGTRAELVLLKGRSAA